jgi:ATP-dependent Clp protease ATP-binding subunit ClpB
VRRRPYSVILLDEMEKAHPDVFNILLQVLDDGRLTDGQGRVVSFKNTIIIMTSNVGSQYIAAADATEDPDTVQRQVNDALRQTFKPEFLNRIDDVVVFRPLGLDDIEKIVDIQLADVRERLDRRRITLELSDAALESLSLEGLDPVYGARPLKRLIQSQVVDNVATQIIDGKLGEGDTVRIDVDENNRFFAERVGGPATVEAPAAAVDSQADDAPIEPDVLE